MFYEKYKKQYDIMHKEITDGVRLDHNSIERNPSADGERMFLLLLYAPCVLIRLLIHGNTSIVGTLIGAAFYWIPVVILFVILYTLCSAILIGAFEKFNTRKMISRGLGWIYPWLSRIVVLAAIALAVVMAFAFGQHKYNETSQAASKTAALSMSVETDGDLTYLIDSDAGNYESTAYIEVKDESGVYRLLPGETLTVSIPYFITVVDATRFDNEMHTYCETKSIYSEEDVMDTTFEVVYAFQPEYYVVGETQPETSPLGLRSIYTIKATTVDE